ncbi:uncharacterized protein [Periplaneta americana]|uniref:uncharacterized protein n=1 Tax=Periplaneta americana TaxID=6978 RepID=UPI0037E719EE
MFGHYLVVLGVAAVILGRRIYNRRRKQCSDEANGSLGTEEEQEMTNTRSKEDELIRVLLDESFRESCSIEAIRTEIFRYKYLKQDVDSKNKDSVDKPSDNVKDMNHPQTPNPSSLRDFYLKNDTIEELWGSFEGNSNVEEVQEAGPGKEDDIAIKSQRLRSEYLDESGPKSQHEVVIDELLEDYVIDNGISGEMRKILLYLKCRYILRRMQLFEEEDEDRK